VKAHVSASLGRLGVRNRVEAAIAAYEAGLTGRGGRPICQLSWLFVGDERQVRPL
jgi:hypothetical protein